MRGPSPAVNAVLYCDQIIAENLKLDARLLDLLDGRGRRVGYLPSGPDPNARFFLAKHAYYRRYGLDLEPFDDLDVAGAHGDAKALFSCDVIHLSGGSTEDFLRRLKRRGILEPLRLWAEAGGVLAGTSAGAILMTPTIALDGLFSGKEPEAIEDAVALDLLPFEYFPHINANPAWMDDLVTYSRRNGRPVAVCADGDGIVVTRGRVECLGDVTWLLNGEVVASPYERA